MKKIKEGKFKIKSLTITEIALLILSIIAFSYLLKLGNEFPLVSAQTEQCVYSQTRPGDFTRVSELNTQEKINEWCEANGRSAVCDGGSKKWILRPRACGSIFEGQRGPSLADQAVSGVVGAGASKVAEKALSPGSPAPPKSLTQERLAEIAAGATPTPEEAACIADKSCVAGAGKKPGGLGAWLNPRTPGNWAGYIISNAAVAGGIYGVTKGIAKLFGADPELANKLAKNAAVAYLVGALAAKVLATFGIESLLTAVLPVLGIPVLGAILAGIAIAFTLIFGKKTRFDLVTFSCLAWDAPTGGSNCDLCNKDDIPCTEYRCRSLGQSCDLLNPGTGREVCVFTDRTDINPPVIKPWEEVLNEEYKYVPDTTVSPPQRGVKIVPENDINGCIAPFTPLNFGITLDKAARCKWSTERPTSFENMENNWMSNGLRLFNHSLGFSIPSPQSAEAEDLELREGGRFSLYIRCETKQGYSNPSDFIFKFCVDKGPDTQAPVITRTSIINNSPIAFNQHEIDLRIFTNEPAQCRWSRLEQAYDDMPAENQVNCPASLSVLDSDTLGDYRCEATTLTGLINSQNNDFYLSCKDQPHLIGTEDEHLRNANEKPFLFRLIGTQPLIIDSVGPNGTIKDSTSVIKVTLTARTSAGADRGAATCYYSPAGQNRFVPFLNPGTHEHSQRLDLVAGTYSYDIRCTDLGGNSDTKTTSFTVETDTQAPVVIRAFREENFLKIITNEKASCVYSTSAQTACNYLFEDGIAMQSLENNKHQIAWDPNKNFYIKCEDEFGNQPFPNQCSIIVRPFEIR